MRGKRKLVAIIVAVGVLVISGLAVAFWTQGGGGTGGASAGTTTAITVRQTNTVTGLYPGGPAVALSGDFDNPNPHPVTVSSVTASVDPFTAQANLAKPACTEGDFAIAGTSGANVVPAGNSQGSWTGLTVQMRNGVANQDNCKNVSIVIRYTANP